MVPSAPIAGEVLTNPRVGYIHFCVPLGFTAYRLLLSEPT
jgi:hypothetical protein